MKPQGSKASSFAPSVSSREKGVQAKLTVNQPGDRYEVEADAMADHVMSMTGAPSFTPTTGMIGKSIQKKCADCEEEEKKGRRVMRKEISGGGFEMSDSFSRTLHRGGGISMPKPTLDFMEGAFSRDFSSVRIHSGADAARMTSDLNAKAFTYGNSIYFNSNQFSPETDQGKWLLAHELTHVDQQGEAPAIQRKCDPTISTCLEELDLDFGESYSSQESLNELALPPNESLGTSPVWPKISGSDQRLIEQMNFKPLLDELILVDQDARRRMEASITNRYGTGPGFGFFPALTYGARRQWSTTGSGDTSRYYMEVQQSEEALKQMLNFLGMKEEETLTLEDRFANFFGQQALLVAGSLLDQSEKVATAELKRYTTIPTDRCSIITTELMQSIERIAAVQDLLITKTNQRVDEVNTFSYIQGSHVGAEDYFRYDDGASIFSQSASLQDVRKSFRKVIDEEGKRFPVLKSEHIDYIGLSKMSEEELKATLIGHATDVLENIQSSRTQLTVDNVWSLPAVIELTKQVMGLDPTSHSSVFIDQYISTKERNAAYLTMFLAAITLIAAVGLMFVTAGTSLAIGLEVVSVLGGTILFSEHVEDYFFQSAARNSAFDVNESIGAGFDQPSLLWLLTDFGLTVLSIGQLANSISKLRTVGTALATVRSADVTFDFARNMEQMCKAKGLVIEQVSEGILRVTKPGTPGEIIITAKGLRFQHPTGNGMMTTFSMSFESAKPEAFVKQLEGGFASGGEALVKTTGGEVRPSIKAASEVAKPAIKTFSPPAAIKPTVSGSVLGSESGLVKSVGGETASSAKAAELVKPPAVPTPSQVASAGKAASNLGPKSKPVPKKPAKTAVAVTTGMPKVSRISSKKAMEIVGENYGGVNIREFYSVINKAREEGFQFNQEAFLKLLRSNPGDALQREGELLRAFRQAHATQPIPQSLVGPLHEPAWAPKLLTREAVLGGTPGKWDSTTGRAVIARLKSEGVVNAAETKVWYEGKWYPIDKCDMAHTRDAVEWWNTEGYFYGAKSKIVRDWMMDPDNYFLEPFQFNRAKGGALTERYVAPHPNPITIDELNGVVDPQNLVEP